MQDHKPIKRHPAIVGLSKDHHLALLLVWKIREGLRHSVDPARVNKYISHFFDTDLIQHFQDEEEFLFSKLPASNELIIQAMEEHRQIHQLVHNLKQNSDDKNLAEMFANTLEKHIRFEERKLFNYLQENLSDEVLAGITTSLHSNEPEHCETWADTFWTERKSEVKSQKS